MVSTLTLTQNPSLSQILCGVLLTPRLIKIFNYHNGEYINSHTKSVIESDFVRVSTDAPLD